MFHGHLDYFQKPSLVGRPNTKLWDHGTRTLTTVGLFYFIVCEDPHDYKFIEVAFGRGPGHIWLHTSVHFKIHDQTTRFWRCLGRPLDTFFWALTISWSRPLARVWSGPNYTASTLECVRASPMALYLHLHLHFSSAMCMEMHEASPMVHVKQ